MEIPVKKGAGGRPMSRPSIETLANLYKDHTAREIAEIYNVREATVYSWINRARKTGK